MDDHTKDDVPEGRQPETSTVKKYAFISRMALEADHIGYCYREHPETLIDSGWRFLYGEEDEDYFEEPGVSISVYPEEMISINPAIDRILSAPIGAEFEWDDDQQTYVEMIGE